jgi:hypothetical protein
MRMTFPFTILKHPDTGVVISQSVEDDQDGHIIVPFFTSGFSPNDFVKNIGMTKVLTRHFSTMFELMRFLSNLISTDDPTRFAINPTDANLLNYPTISAKELEDRLRPARGISDLPDVQD